MRPIPTDKQQETKTAEYADANDTLTIHRPLSFGEGVWPDTTRWKLLACLMHQGIEEFDLVNNETDRTEPGWKADRDVAHHVGVDCNVVVAGAWVTVVELDAFGLLERTKVGDGPGTWICEEHHCVTAHALRITKAGYMAMVDLRYSAADNIVIHSPPQEDA